MDFYQSLCYQSNNNGLSDKTCIREEVWDFWEYMHYLIIKRRAKNRAWRGLHSDRQELVARSTSFGNRENLLSEKDLVSAHNHFEGQVESSLKFRWGWRWQWKIDGQVRTSCSFLVFHVFWRYCSFEFERVPRFRRQRRSRGSHAASSQGVLDRIMSVVILQV